MKRLYLVCFLLSCCAVSFGQAGKVTGSVKDAETKAPLELATVTVFGQDSSIVAYQLSDANGMFTIEKLPLKKKLRVSITYTGYAGQSLPVELNGPKPDTLTVFLSLSNKDTQGVVVTATIPIRMNGDTLEINPAAFKLKNDAVVEELLNQVSGITIWSDGTITVNGKKVESLLVDGKPFMGTSDSRVATQNLPKSAIDKIQLYQEYDRSNIGRESQPQDSLLTMNIKLKEGSKKGYFGKAGAGAGTDQRFESDLSFQIYNKQSNAGIGGGFNNINKNIGNLQEMFQNNTYRNYNPNLYNVGRFGTNGINKNHSFGGVVVHSFIESANSRQNDRLTVSYNKSGTDANITDLTLENRTTVEKPQFSRTDGVQNNLQDKHDVGINYIKTDSYSDNLNMNATINTSRDKGNSFRYSEVRDSAGQLQNTSRTSTVSDRRSDNESLSASFSRFDNDAPSKSFGIQINARRSNVTSERDVISVFESFTDASKNFSNNRRYVSDNKSVYLSGSLDYLGFKRFLLGRYNLFGIGITLNNWFSYSRTTDNSMVSDYDSSGRRYIANGDLSNLNKRELLEYTSTLALSKSFFRWSEKYSRSIYLQFRLSDDFKTDRNISSFDKRNLDRSFQFLRYEGSFSFQYQKREKYRYYGSGHYSRQFEYPSVDRLYTIVDSIQAYDTRFGNPLLKNTINHIHSVNIGFNTENPKSVYSINGNANAGYNRSIDPVTDSVINDRSGKRLYYYINGDKTNNINLGYSLNVSRKIKKNNIQLMYTGQFRKGKVPNYVDHESNISQTRNLYNQFTLQFTLGSILVLNASQSMQSYKSMSTAPEPRLSKNSSNTTKFGIVLNYPVNLTFSSTLDRIANSDVSEPVILWNAFLTYRFMKQQGELKFSAMDLLKRYQNISSNPTGFGTMTRITNGLQQYFLVTFSYYPRKFGKTEIRKRSDEQRR